MIPSKYQDYIDKIIFLEKQFGKRVGYNNIKPFSLDAEDIIDIQKAAKRITEFIGLKGYTFNVSINSQMQEAGKIELKPDGKDVFIELSERHLVNEKTVLAILAHEITHKYLDRNGVRLEASTIKRYENEILTDITAVFLGLGKLMLNGCEYSTSYTTPTVQGQRRTTKEYKVGYLKKEEICFVYCLVCNMRRINKAEFKKSLTPKSKRCVESCLSTYNNIFNNEFHNLDIKDQLASKLNEKIRETQGYLLKVDKRLRYIKQASVKVTEDFLKNTHKQIRKNQKEIEDGDEKINNDPCLRFLNALQFSDKIDKKITDLDQIENTSLEYKNSLSKLSTKINDLGKPFLSPRSEMFKSAICRIDNTEFKKDKEGDFLAECPKCKYKFLTNTSPPNIGGEDKVANNSFAFFGKKIKIRKWLKFTPFLFIFLRSLVGHHTTLFIVLEVLIFANIIYLIWKINNISGKILKRFSIFLAFISFLLLFAENVSGIVYGIIIVILLLLILKCENN